MVTVLIINVVKRDNIVIGDEFYDLIMFKTQ